MSNKIMDEIKNRIKNYAVGDVFFTSDFNDIASLPTVRKCLGRLAADGTIRRINDGIYEKPEYSKILGEYLPTNPEKMAYALAKKYHWTISPCGDVALNKLGLSTQVPVVWSYVSDGPYREYKLGNTSLTFKHRTNREITHLSSTSIMVIEALKTLGKDNVNEHTVSVLKNRLTKSEKADLLKDSADASAWIFNLVKEV